MGHSRSRTIAMCALVSGVTALLAVFLFASLAGKKPLEVAILSVWAYLVMTILGMLICGYVLTLMPSPENPSVMDEPPTQVDFIQMPEMPPLPTPSQDLSRPESEMKAVAAPGSPAAVPPEAPPAPKPGPGIPS